jgi:hypothetical protein
MPHIMPETKANESNSNNIVIKSNLTLHNIKLDEKEKDLNALTIIFLIIGSVSLIVLILIIVYLIIPLRNLKRIASKPVIKSNLEYYDDSREPQQYDAIQDVNEYAHNYEEIVEYHGNDGIDEGMKETNINAIIHQKEERNSLHIYLSIE